MPGPHAPTPSSVARLAVHSGFMGLRDRMQDAGRRAGAAVGKGASTVAGAAKGVAGNVAGGAAWANSSLDGLPMPAAPAGEPWELSVAGLIRRRRDIPKA